MDIGWIRSRTWAEIDLDGLLHNYQSAQQLIGPHVRLAAVLKANAYGHGAVPVAKALYEYGMEIAMVACLSEALELRRALPHLRILIMGYTAPEAMADALQADIALTVFSLAQAQTASALAEKLHKTAVLHVKIDTGFHRLGMPPGEDTARQIAAMAKLPHVKLEGLFTHLALTAATQDTLQIDRFMQVKSALAHKGVSLPLYHVCDSIGMVRYPAWRMDLVRAGAFLYGVRPSRWDNPLQLVPTLTLKTRIAQIHELPAGEGIGYDATFVTPRPSRIAALPVGYADGVPRCMSNTAQVALHGKRAPVVGLLCMDQMMVDITDIPEAREGDEVVLLGGTGADAIPYLEYADWAKTNRNEAISAISRRVPRVYLQGGRIVHIADETMGGAGR